MAFPLVYTTRRVVVSFHIALIIFLDMSICTVAFSTAPILSNARRQARMNLDRPILLAETNNGNPDTSNHHSYGSEEAFESSKTNEWGIPDSRTLRPFGSQPVTQLENGGRITLVGSGPGDPDLLTRKAYTILQDPDALVICDRLISPEIVSLVKGEVKTARKLPGCAELAQEEIYWWVHQGLSNGKHVIRLKIGDPFVFGRGGEEVLKFRQLGVESVVIPVRFYSLVFGNCEEIVGWQTMFMNMQIIFSDILFLFFLSFY